jgi:Leucine-rich repeat (LRR) protein
VKNVVWIGLMSFLGCQSGGVELSGEAKTPGNPAKFIELCSKGEETAKAIMVATGATDCTSAGEIVKQISSIDFNHAELTVVKFDALDSLSNIERLESYGKGIVDLTPLSGLVRLERLYLMQNKVVDITPLEPLSQLRHIRLDGNQIVDISTLSKLRNLEKIGLDANKISDFRPLASLPYITDLNTNFNPVDLDKCPIEEGTAARLLKYCKRMIKNEVNLQDAIDPKQ